MSKKIFIFMFLINCSYIYSAGIPTFDSSNFNQSYITALENVKQTQQQLQQYVTQLKQLKEQLKNSAMPQDMLDGMLNELLGNIKNINSSMNSNGSLRQFSNYNPSSGGSSSGGSSSGGNYFSSTIGDSSMSNYSKDVYKDHNYYLQAPQTEERKYTTAGSEAINMTTDELLASLEKQQKDVEEFLNTGMEELKKKMEESAEDKEGGTNKILATQNILLLSLIKETIAIRQMMIAKDTAEVTALKNYNARIQDQEAQTKILLKRGDVAVPSTNSKPLEFR